MSAYPRAQYARNREETLAHIVAFLSQDERFVAARLTGSLGRGDGDELSDIDLRVVVADAHAERLCACAPQLSAGVASAERLALYEQFGRPLVFCEAPSFGPTGGCFNQTAYRETAVTVDWVLLPQKDAHLPRRECRVLFDKVGLPTEPPPAPEEMEERLSSAARDIHLFWMMTSISVKYLLRDIMMGDRFIYGNAYLLQGVKQRLAGETPHYQHITLPLATTRSEQAAQIRQQCTEMLVEMTKLAALGGQVPDDPMSIIETWLSIV